jgi:hypothetical protein
MATSLQERTIIRAEISSSDDEYSIEYYDYETVDEKMGEQDGQFGPVSAETVEDDDYDEYTYEEEEIMDVVMVEKVNDMDTDSTIAPPPLPAYRSNGPNSSPSLTTLKPPAPSKPPPTKVPSSSPVTRTSPYTPSYGRKEAPVDGLKEAPTLLSPSKQRAKAANSTGLSELSKQLRILQAKNESQNVDINRLERQLRILADLQGISVGDLRKALEDACASEAFGELQNRVSKLKYELEAATLAKQKELRKDAAAPHIANLELRVGELEEVEEKQMKEIRDLYQDLRQEKARSTRFESENQQLKGALQDMINRVQSETARAAQAETNSQKQLQEVRERQAKNMQEQAERSRSASSSADKQARKGAENPSSMVSPEFVAEYEEIVQLLKKKNEELRNVKAKLHTDEIRRAEALKYAEKRSRQVEMDIKVKADQLALTVKELEDADGQNGLRLAQFKARFAVQDENIVDMGQQLDSLYTAFDLLKEEFDSENDQRAAMLSNLNDADAEIARQTKKQEETESASRHKRDHKFPPSPIARNSSNASTATLGSNKASVPHFINNSPGVTTRRPMISTLAPVSPATPAPTRTYQTMTPFSNNTTNMSYDRSMTSNSNNTTDRMYSNNTTDRMYSNNTNDMNDAGYNEIHTAYASAQAFQPTPERTPNTWEIFGNDHKNRSGRGDHHQREGELICGSLIVESNGMLRKWKTKPSRIYLRADGYQWEIGEKRSFPLQFGISKVEFHPNHPLSFAVCLDPTSSNSPTIRAAADNEHDYHRWMTALNKATTGEDYQGKIGLDSLETTPSPSPPRYGSSGTGRSSKTDRFAHLKRPASNRSAPSASRVEEPEDADLQRILELSKYET